MLLEWEHSNGDRQMTQIAKGQTVRNTITGMTGTVVRLGDPHKWDEKGGAWVRFERHGMFCQALESLEVVA